MWSSAARPPTALRSRTRPTPAPRSSFARSTWCAPKSSWPWEPPQPPICSACVSPWPAYADASTPSRHQAHHHLPPGLSSPRPPPEEGSLGRPPNRHARTRPQTAQQSLTIGCWPAVGWLFHSFTTANPPCPILSAFFCGKGGKPRISSRRDFCRALLLHKDFLSPISVILSAA